MGGFLFSIMFAFVMWMAAIAMAIMAAIAVCALINYIFEGIFLYRVSQIRGYSYGFLAWIPLVNKLRLGQIAGKKKVGVFLMILDIICIACFAEMCHVPEFLVDTSLNTVIGIIWLVTAPTVFVLNIYLSHRIMKKVMPRWTDLLTLVNVFTAGLSRSIILFLIRNRKELLIQDTHLNSEASQTAGANQVHQSAASSERANLELPAEQPPTQY